MKKNYFLTLLFSSTIAFSQTQIGNTINGIAANEESGYSVALSGNGNIVAIGAPKNNSGKGRARVFQNSAGTWNQIGSDIVGLQANGQTGYSVSLSDDGTVLAVGTPYGGGPPGTVSIYKNVSNVWTQIGGNISGEAGDDWNGLSVSLSSDGNVIAIGAPGNDANAVNSGDRGHVRVFRNVGNIWTQIGADIDGLTNYGFSGWSVSLSDDGTVVAVGAYNDGPGSVRIYKNNSNVWTQIGSVINAEVGGDNFGESVSLSGDGMVVAIGGSDTTASNNYKGQVSIYKNIANIWTQIGATIDGAPGSGSGKSVSLSNDGSMVAIGGYLYDSARGQCKIFKNISGNWIQTASDINGSAIIDYSGYSVSLSSDGSAVAIGARYADNNSVTNSGHVRIFSLQGILKTDDYILQNFTVSPNPATDFVNIILQKNLVLERVNVYTTLGQLIKSSTASKISVQDLSKGNYYFEIITNKGKATKKIIVE
ncbi:T9SS type A sorting domain-containing protein [Chryseobacterium sp. JJR-5R]|uniref:T9SS type A sorting domain-containing protein n=1 Tax=Chryseobacterium sp. JJR-5R TaxID=3093923 RepID=UPI002A763615|nr:T9SS type A sorting domain-containing protein [Chryseobacterium sp. JJR-5R]WPO82664.1 T9SS type A sorting domain-containing protein [Chryseobacterium sp. JJR-5R]